MPAGFSLELGDGLVGLLEIGENGKASLVIGQAVLGRRRAARGAIEQLDPELGFEIDHIFADGGARQPQLLRRLREASLRDDFGESSYTRQLVHAEFFACVSPISALTIGTTPDRLSTIHGQCGDDCRDCPVRPSDKY